MRKVFVSKADAGIHNLAGLTFSINLLRLTLPFALCILLVHLEYGFPSTHTSNATSIALYLLSYLLISDWSVLAKVASIAGLCVYLFSVIFGRLYCGMHTKTDIIGGTVIGILVWAAQWSFHDAIDSLMTSPSWTGTYISSCI